MNTTPTNPQDLMLDPTLTEGQTTKSMLDALQVHYDTLYRNQKIYIEYLTELVEKMKDVQKGDKESFSALKKEVIKHVLDSEKKRQSTPGV